MAKRPGRPWEAELADLDAKLDRLTDVYLAGELTRDEYLPRKEKWLHAKAELKAKWASVAVNGNCWLEPLRQFIETCNHAALLAQQADAAKIAGFLKSAGSNLTLKARRARPDWVPPWAVVAKNRGNLVWWRRRDLNPRPKSHLKESLQA